MPRISARGFSLLELLLVAAIVALLGAVAYPGYQRHLAAGRRVAAAACLLEHAQLMERHFAAGHGYLDAPEPVLCHGLAGFYQLSFVAPPSAGAYLLQAVPHAGQAIHDADCGVLSLNQWGERMVSAGIEPARCW